MFPCVSGATVTVNCGPAYRWNFSSQGIFAADICVIACRKLLIGARLQYIQRVVTDFSRQTALSSFNPLSSVGFFATQ